jgi:hypothetical protein
MRSLLYVLAALFSFSFIGWSAVSIWLIAINESPVAQDFPVEGGHEQ